MDESSLPGESTLLKPEKAPPLLLQYPGIQKLMEPMANAHPLVNEAKIRRLYLQGSSQQWFIPDRLNFEEEWTLGEDSRKTWAKIMTIFYTLEKMGLDVIHYMLPKAVSKLRSDEVSHYLSVQSLDESRHVFAVENYLKRLNSPPAYDRKLHVLGQMASLGFYRVENWLFSTLFSENFASAFLRRLRTAKIDDLGLRMARGILTDESRHIHFLQIVLPDILDRLSLFGRTYVKASQFFIMKFTEAASKAVEKDASDVGIDRVSLIEEVFENVEKAYEQFGVTRDYLWFPKLSSSSSSSSSPKPSPSAA